MSDDSYRHFYLYAKHWYKHVDMIKDLRSVVAVRCCLPFEHVKEKDVILVLTGAVKSHIKFDRFMNDLMDQTWLYPNDDMNTKLIRGMLHVLLATEKKDIPFDLGKPDSNILQLKEKLDE